jgi:hypothetical protein
LKFGPQHVDLFRKASLVKCRQEPIALGDAVVPIFPGIARSGLFLKKAVIFFCQIADHPFHSLPLRTLGELRQIFTISGVAFQKIGGGNLFSGPRNMRSQQLPDTANGFIDLVGIAALGIFR